MQNEFHHTLSKRWTNLIAGWAYAELISSLAEHTRKCLKVKYLGRIEYDFQKSHVTVHWGHKVSVSAKEVKQKFHACVPLNNQLIWQNHSLGTDLWLDYFGRPQVWNVKYLKDARKRNISIWCISLRIVCTTESVIAVLTQF